MFKRLITMLVLLTIAFFIFRWISPKGAEALVNKVRTVYARIFNKNMLTGAVLPQTGDLALLTGSLSGEIITSTGETVTTTGETNTGATELSGAVETGVTITGNVGPSSTPKPTFTPSPTPAPSSVTNDITTSVKSSSTKATPPQGLSTKDLSDAQKTLGNLFK